MAVESAEIAHKIEEVVEEEHRELEAERKANRAQEKYRNALAAMIAGLAALLAIASLGGETAGIHLITGSILTADSYAFYQAKNIRQTSVSLAADDLELTLQNAGVYVSPDARLAFQKKIDQYRATAARYESEPDPKHPNDPMYGEGKKELLYRATYWEKNRDHAEMQVPNFHYAEALFQIAIVLGSVAIITHRKWIVGVIAVLGVVAMVMTLNGFFLFFHLPGTGH
jgi:hypothetical protein